jgi:hypothetical protein
MWSPNHKIPFQSLTLLGLWFIGPYVLLPAALAYGYYDERLWAWKPALYLAIIEVIWVIVRIPMVGRSVLQAVIGSIAVATVYFLYRPSVWRYLDKLFMVDTEPVKARGVWG